MTINIEPPVTDEVCLVEQRSVRAQEGEDGLRWGGTDVEYLAVAERGGVSVVTCKHISSLIMSDKDFD